MCIKLYWNLTNFPQTSHPPEDSNYDELSDQGYTSLPKPDESESGQMVLTNNVESYKKFNEKAQTANFSDLTRQRQELCAESAKKHQN